MAHQVAITITLCKVQRVCDRDCKDWLDHGHNKSGIYPVNPDGQESFQVKKTKTILYSLYLQLYRCIVIWRLMVVDGLTYRGEKVD